MLGLVVVGAPVGVELGNMLTVGLGVGKAVSATLVVGAAVGLKVVTASGQIGLQMVGQFFLYTRRVHLRICFSVSKPASSAHDVSR